jgi:hypothetical protein
VRIELFANPDVTSAVVCTELGERLFAASVLSPKSFACSFWASFRTKPAIAINALVPLNAIGPAIFCGP